MKPHHFLKHLVAIMFFSILLSGCNKAKKDWEKAQSINTFQGFQDFLKLHPESDFAIYAADSIDWILTQKSDSVEKYRDFLVKYPNSNHAKIAKQYIDMNIPSNYKSAIDLMLVFWFNFIKPVEREGIAIFGIESLMVSSTGKANGIIKLDSMRYSQTIINKLIKYKDVKCSIEVKDVKHNYFGTKTMINENSLFSCKIEGNLNLGIAIKKGEFGIQENKDFVISDGTAITIDDKVYTFLNKHWTKN